MHHRTIIVYIAALMTPFLMYGAVDFYPTVEKRADNPPPPTVYPAPPNRLN